MPSSSLGYRRSAVGPRTVVLAATFAGPPDDAERGADAHRRDRALAAGAPARRPERGLGVHQPAGRRGRAGSSRRAGARACGSAAPWSPRSTRTSSSPSPARRPPTCSARHARCSGVSTAGTGVHLEPELHLVGFAMARRTVTTTDDDRRRCDHRGSVNAASKCSARPDGAGCGHAAGGRVALVAVGLVYLLVESPLLDVDHVRVNGVQHVDPQQVIDAAHVRHRRAAATRRRGRGRTPHRAVAVGRARAMSTAQAAGHVAHHGHRVRVPVAYVRRDDTHVAVLDAAWLRHHASCRAPLAGRRRSAAARRRSRRSRGTADAGRRRRRRARALPPDLARGSPRRVQRRRRRVGAARRWGRCGSATRDRPRREGRGRARGASHRVGSDTVRLHRRVRAARHRSRGGVPGA